MATALTTGPPRPTSVSGAKGFANKVVDNSLWIAAAVLAFGVAMWARPYAARIPIVGPLLNMAPGGANVDGYGTVMGA